MIHIKFELINSITEQVIGTEYLIRDEGWKNNVFGFGERDGTFDQKELGDDFLGYILRTPIFENKNEDKETPYYDWTLDGVYNIRYDFEQELFKPLLKEMEEFIQNNNQTAFYSYKNFLEKVLGLSSVLRIVIGLQEARLALK